MRRPPGDPGPGAPDPPSRRPWAFVASALGLAATAFVFYAAEVIPILEFDHRVLLGEEEDSGMAQALPKTDEIHTLEIAEWAIDSVYFLIAFVLTWLQNYRVSFGDVSGKMKETWEMRQLFLFNAGSWFVRVALFDMKWLLVSVPHWWRVNCICYLVNYVLCSRAIVFWFYMMVKTDMTSVLSCSKKEVQNWEFKCKTFANCSTVFFIILYPIASVVNLMFIVRLRLVNWLLHCGLWGYSIYAMYTVAKRVDQLCKNMVSVRLNAEKKMGSMKSIAADSEKETTESSKISTIQVDTKNGLQNVPLNANEAKLFAASKRIKKKSLIALIPLIIATVIILGKVLPPYDLKESLVDGFYTYDEYNWESTNKTGMMIVTYHLYHGWKPITWKR